MSVLTSLRSIAPQHRALTPSEARSVAERQARRFRVLTGYDDEPMLPNQVMLNLPRIRVVLAVSMNYAGLSGWDHDSRQWQIVINGRDAPARQRFTLAHEYKHVIDYTTHQANYRTFGSYSAHDQGEDVCDYFAGCLLIPKHLLKRVWSDGIQDTRDLAQLFGVSKAAMRVRLCQTGTVPNGRHDLFTRLTSPGVESIASLLDPEWKVAMR